MDEVDFLKQQEILLYRKTWLGWTQFKFGKVIAIYYIIRMGLAIKQMLYPVYNAQVMDKNMRYVLLYFSYDDGQDDLSLSIKVQYLGLLFTAFLIVSNVQSFLRKLLVTLKYILRDNEI